MYIKFAKFDLLHNCTMHMMMLQDSIMIMCPRWWQGGAQYQGEGDELWSRDTESGSSGLCWLLVLGEVSVLIAGTIASTLGPTHFILHFTVILSTLKINKIE